MEDWYFLDDGPKASTSGVSEAREVKEANPMTQLTPSYPN